MNPTLRATLIGLLVGCTSTCCAQIETARPSVRSEELRGAYGQYRANNDLLWYHLDVRVDPEKQTIAGTNTIRFKMLQDDNRIQLDLYPNLNVDGIKMGSTPLKHTREEGAVFVDFPETLNRGKTYSIEFRYSATVSGGRRGGLSFGKDPADRPWITTSCEGPGSSSWWPSKDQWKDEPDNGIEISVAVPNEYMDVSNGRFKGKTDLGDGYTRWDWLVKYPINSYDVSLNIAKYVHFSDRLRDLTMDFYVLPEDLDKAKTQFAQAKPMLQAYEHYFGEYPFKKDGYKLVQVPYAGMEHQSAVTYGNHFKNGYFERDFTGVGINSKFDYIIIHESGHEWFGNAVSASDVSDMWIHEGWTTYLEDLYVEYMWGREDGLKYVNAYKSKVQNQRPIITERGLRRTPPQDMYFKGTLFLNTLRSVVDDDKRWFKLIRDLYQHFKYKNILTEEMVAWVNGQLGRYLTPIFDAYLRHAEIPTLEMRFSSGKVEYRWDVAEKAFNMPIRVGKRGAWQMIQPTTEWKSMPTTLAPDQFEVATDRYYVNVKKL